MGLFSSKSSSSVTNESTDASTVAGNDSIVNAPHIRGDYNTVTTTDYGAVSGSLALAMKGIESAHTQARQTVESQGHLLDGVLRMAGQQSEQHAADLMAVKTGDTRTTVIAAAAIAGLALVAVIKKGKA